MLIEIVNFLSAADHITMLEEGVIVRNQVTYDSVEPTVWGVLEADVTAQEELPETDEEESTKPLNKVETLTAQARKTEEDLSRKTGDVECYKIYLRSMGLGAVAILVITVACHVAIQKMPRP